MPMLAPINHALSERTDLARQLFQSADDLAFASIVRTLVRLCGMYESRHCRRLAETQTLHSKSPVLRATVNQMNNSTVSQTLPLESPIVRNHEKPEVPGQMNSNPGFIEQRANELQEKVPICPIDLSKVRRARPTLICLFCCGKGGRKQPFPRKDSLRRHYRTRHFPYQVGAFLCPVPKCSQLINDPDHFCNHAVSVHKSDLGVRASIMGTKARRAKPGQLATFSL